MAEKALVERLKTLTPDQIKAGLAARVLQVSSSTFHYLKFDGRSGVMNVHDGDKEARFDERTELAFNLLGSKQGYVCWKGGEVIDMFEQPIVLGVLPPIETMEDHSPYEDEEKDGWQTQYQLFFKDLGKNTQYILRIVSKSGRKQVDNFIKSIHDNMAVHDFTVQTPVITIAPQQFIAQQRKNYKPVFTITKWVDNPKELAVTHADPAPKDAGHKRVAHGTGVNVKLDAETIEDSRD